MSMAAGDGLLGLAWAAPLFAPFFVCINFELPLALSRLYRQCRYMRRSKGSNPRRPVVARQFNTMIHEYTGDRAHHTCSVPLPSTILQTHQWRSAHQHKWFDRCMIMAALRRRPRPCLLFCMCCHLPEKSNAVCFFLVAGIYPSTKSAGVTKILC